MSVNYYLVSCPRCYCNPGFRMHSREYESGRTTTFWVICCSCGYRGPGCGSQSHAESEWNENAVKDQTIA